MEKLRVALCLYGQPRKLYEGYMSIHKHILSKYTVDVFYHAWGTKEPYVVSKNRPIDTTPLQDITEIERLYKPTRFKVEQAKDLLPMPSQIYSRIAVRDVLASYISETHVNYNFVITTRFDIEFLKFPDLRDITGRGIFDQNIFIANDQDFYLDVMNIRETRSKSIHNLIIDRLGARFLEFDMADHRKVYINLL